MKYVRMLTWLKFLRRFCRSTAIEWPIKRSFLYRLYLKIKSPDKLVQNLVEEKFYNNLLKEFRNPFIYDIGANRGEKTQIFLDLGANVVCIDPEPACVELLSRRFANYGTRVKVVHAALSEKQGEATLFVHEGQSGYNTLEPDWAASVSNNTGKNPDSIKVLTQTFEALIEKFGRPDFAKIDVEGYEEKVLSGLAQSIPIMTFEVNLPDFATHGASCIRKLAQIDPAATFNYFVSCARGEELQAPLLADGFLPLYESIRESSIEIVCRMNSVSKHL